MSDIVKSSETNICIHQKCNNSPGNVYNAEALEGHKDIFSEDTSSSDKEMGFTSRIGAENLEVQSYQVNYEI